MTWLVLLSCAPRTVSVCNAGLADARELDCSAMAGPHYSAYMRAVVLVTLCACAHVEPAAAPRDPAVRETLQLRMQPGAASGLTQWQVEYRYSLVEERGVCRLRNPRVVLALQQILPTASAFAEPSLVARLDVLVSHEDGHLRIDRRAAADLAHALRSIEPQASCAAVNDAAERAAAQIIADCRSRNDAFDRTTDHGLR
jgi:predicted secreted Zn-dependent protease